MIHISESQVRRRMMEYVKENNLSLPKIADASGVNYYRLYRVCYGKNRIRLEDYVNFCNAVREPLDYFLKEEKL